MAQWIVHHVVQHARIAGAQKVPRGAHFRPVSCRFQAFQAISGMESSLRSYETTRAARDAALQLTASTKKKGETSERRLAFWRLDS